MRSREQSKFICFGLSCPEEPGGLGLTDATAGQAMQAVRHALPRREPYFWPQAKYRRSPKRHGLHRRSPKRHGLHRRSRKRHGLHRRSRKRHGLHRGSRKRHGLHRGSRKLPVRRKCYDFAPNRFTSPETKSYYQHLKLLYRHPLSILAGKVNIFPAKPVHFPQDQREGVRCALP